MEELHDIATAHYEAGNRKVQELAHEFFDSMDTDGDGHVDLPEFLIFMRQEGYAHLGNPHFFNELDRDGDGSLDFFEVMTVYYIIKSGRPFCSWCGNFIPGIFFSCAECYKSPRGSFNLCRVCYGAATITMGVLSFWTTLLCWRRKRVPLFHRHQGQTRMR